MPPTRPRHRGAAARSRRPSGGGATGSASSRLALQQRLVERPHQILDLRRHLGPVDRGAELGGARQTLRVPADMLPRDMDARRPVMAEHLVVMMAQDLVL